jgi:16S rRNA (cytosine1402-N4)-methyltransferase
VEEHGGAQSDRHIPVLVQEVISGLRCHSLGIYVDCTVGQGGLAKAILDATSPHGRLVGVDRDPEAIAASRRRLQEYGDRVQLIQGHFADVQMHARQAGYPHVDGIVFDLGVSSAQLDNPSRGFSFLSDGPLDMRMDQTTGCTAADLLQTRSETELADIIFRYGEERYARRIARAIVRARSHEPLRTTSELASIVKGAVPPAYRHGRIHCATRTFQALRIEVNRELEDLERAFEGAAGALAPGGRLCIMSFHSLEDRIAKQTLRRLGRGADASLEILTKKPVIASDEERRMNPRARSAKLRIAERLPQGRSA